MHEGQFPVFLDCTLRDGGYQNNWLFSIDATKRYLGSLNSVGVHLIEVGLRAPFQPQIFQGLAAYCPELYLNQVRDFTDKPIGVLVNSKDWPTSKRDYELSLDWVSLSHAVDFVRIATTVDNIEVAVLQAEEAHHHGLSVYLNLMQAHSITYREREKVVNSLGEKSGLAALYLADSFGAMSPSDVYDMVSIMADETSMPIGFHAHDNRGLALANAEAASQAGASYLDGTFAGMGRGAGNARMEQLLLEFNDSTSFQVEFSNFLESGKALVQAAWPISGLDENYLYTIAAKRGVHPTYVQQISESGEFSIAESVNAINVLSFEDASNYTERLLELGWIWFSESPEVEVEIEEIGFENRVVLLVGSGKSLGEFGKEISAFIRENDPFSAYVGMQAGPLKDKYIKRRFVSNPFSLISGVESSGESDQILISPWAQIPERYSRLVPAEKKINVPIKLEVDSVGIDSSGALILPNSRSSTFAIVATVLMGADRVVLAGFDGYEGVDQRNNEFAEVLRRTLNHREIEVTSLTPTRVPIPYEETF